tara:strand:+ start:37 stop:1311 length:1275 start_codon:yes stop_codon:yes gene_type:complete
MKSLLNKFFFRSNNLETVSKNIRDLSLSTPIKKIFDLINNYSEESELRYVGGCIRKIINKERVDDIDLATNLEPYTICELLKKNKINYYETGISHGTITILIDNFKFEITSLREDISTDGRHAKVKFSKNWKEDASRRDFTINSIYSDIDGNLFDPFGGKKDLEKGIINFIGEADKRIKEDYLRILRYVRFYLLYSKQPHNSSLIRKFKINIDGVSKISKDRLLDELKKIIKSGTLEKLSKDKISLDLIQTIFPELRNIHIFSKLKLSQKEIIKKSDLIFLISLMIIDDTDNADYFLYKFNLSKKDQIRIKLIDNFFKEKKSLKKLNEKIMNKVFYYNGKQSALDIISFKIIKSKNIDDELFELSKIYLNKSVPTMPISAELLMQKYKIPEGKQLGVKLKNIEEVWVDHNFQITDQQLENILNN